jgi:16S rRNA (guanine527-N7)-methyltransferase
VFAELIRPRLQGVLEISGAQVELLEAHYELLTRWNRVLNLTAIRNAEEAAERHYCEALFLAAHIRKGVGTVADVGSGAGFPGLPVAVVRPEVQVVLIESHQRKAVFLREASRGLANVRVVSVRAESVRERFDLVISRAVSYGDLEAAIKSLAPAADLLTGAGEPPASLGLVWDEPIALPWGRNRYLRHGRAVDEGCST